MTLISPKNGTQVKGDAMIHRPHSEVKLTAILWKLPACIRISD